MADAEKKKPSLALVIGMGKAKEKDPTDTDGGVEESEEDFDTAAEECFEAIKSDDLQGFKDAMRAIKSC